MDIFLFLLLLIATHCSLLLIAFFYWRNTCIVEETVTKKDIKRVVKELIDDTIAMGGFSYYGVELLKEIFDEEDKKGCKYNILIKSS